MPAAGEISAAFSPAGPPPTTTTRRARRRRLRLAALLAADVGVVEAGDRQAADHAVDAALVGADAVPDALAVADLSTRSGSAISARVIATMSQSRLERLLRDGGVVDPARGDDRHAGADRLAQPVRERQELAEAVAVAPDRAGVVPGAGALGLAHVIELAGVDERARDLAQPSTPSRRARAT